MSTPMHDTPEHLTVGMTADGRGPVAEWDPEFDHYGCWCGDPDCTYERDQSARAREIFERIIVRDKDLLDRLADS